MAYWFAASPGWHARADILDDLELDVADWNRVIGGRPTGVLVDSGEVVRKGEKRGTRYRWWEHEERLLF